MPNAIDARSMGKGTIRLSERVEEFEVPALQPPAPSSTGRFEGQLARHEPYIVKWERD